jgi:hypothetical protein
MGRFWDEIELLDYGFVGWGDSVSYGVILTDPGCNVWDGRNYSMVDGNTQPHPVVSVATLWPPPAWPTGRYRVGHPQGVWQDLKVPITLPPQTCPSPDARARGAAFEAQKILCLQNDDGPSVAQGDAEGECHAQADHVKK